MYRTVSHLLAVFLTRMFFKFFLVVKRCSTHIAFVFICHTKSCTRPSLLKVVANGLYDGNATVSHDRDTFFMATSRTPFGRL